MNFITNVLYYCIISKIWIDPLVIIKLIQYTLQRIQIRIISTFIYFYLTKKSEVTYVGTNTERKVYLASSHRFHSLHVFGSQSEINVTANAAPYPCPKRERREREVEWWLWGNEWVRVMRVTQQRKRNCFSKQQIIRLRNILCCIQQTFSLFNNVNSNGTVTMRRLKVHDNNCILW